MTAKQNTINCPTCQEKTEWNEDNKYRPFCSHRCRLIDFGEWANESNRIPENVIENPEDFNNWDEPPLH